MKTVLVFDVVGTLLDLSALDNEFQEIFGHSGVRREWFNEVQILFLTSIAIDAYTEFTKITEGALKVVEQRHNKTLTAGQRTDLLSKMKELPIFPDVKEGLQMLRDAGFTLALLTNSASRSVVQALKGAGILHHFQKVLSADSVKRFKPSPAPYQMAAKELGVGISSVMLVAAHAWDVSGAKSAGCQTCFVSRPDEVLYEITPKPDLIASDLRDLSRQIASRSAA